MGCLSSKLEDTVPAGKDPSDESSRNYLPTIRIIRSTTATPRESLSSIPENHFRLENIDTSFTLADDFLSRTVALSAMRSNSNNSFDLLSDSRSLSSAPLGCQKALASSIGSVHSRLLHNEDGLETKGLDTTGSSPIVINRSISFDDFIMDQDDWNEPFATHPAPIVIVEKRLPVKTSIETIEVAARNRKQSLTPLKFAAISANGRIGRLVSLQPLSPKKFPQRSIASVGKNISGGHHESYSVGSIDDAIISPRDKNVKSIVAQIESPRQVNSSRNLDVYFSNPPQKSRHKTSSTNSERNLSRSSSLGQVLQRDVVDARIQRQRRPSLTVYKTGSNEEIKSAGYSTFTLPMGFVPVTIKNSACKSHQIHYPHDSLSKRDLKPELSIVIAS